MNQQAKCISIAIGTMMIKLFIPVYKQIDWQTVKNKKTTHPNFRRFSWDVVELLRSSPWAR